MHEPAPIALSHRVPVFPMLFVALAANVAAQTTTQGPSSSRPPYLVPTAPPGVVRGMTSIVTSTDHVQRTGAPPGTSYEVAGKPDGLGAFDNGNGTITVLMSQ